MRPIPLGFALGASLAATLSGATDLEFQLDNLERLSRDATLILRLGPDSQPIATPEQANVWCYRFTWTEALLGQPPDQVIGCASIHLERPVAERLAGSIIFLRAPFDGFEPEHSIDLDGQQEYRVVAGPHGIRTDIDVETLREFLAARANAALVTWAERHLGPADGLVERSSVYLLAEDVHERGFPGSANALLSTGRRADRALSRFALDLLARSSYPSRFEMLSGVAADQALPQDVRMDSLAVMGQHRDGLGRIRTLAIENSPASELSREYLRERTAILPLRDSVSGLSQSGRLTSFEWSALERKITQLDSAEARGAALALGPLAKLDVPEATRLLGLLAASAEAPQDVRLGAASLVALSDTDNRVDVLQDTYRASSDPKVKDLVARRLKDIERTTGENSPH
jgi:hypothetical protein